MSKDFFSLLKKTFASMKDNVGFILVCLAITIGVFLIALLFQKLLLKHREQKVNSTRRITYTALFSCMAVVLMLFELPLPFAPSFYKIDFSELPIMICTFFLGPVYGVTAELIKIVLKIMVKGTSTAFVGDFANFIIGCAFVLPASIIYHAKPSRTSALIGLIVGTLIMTVFGSAFNAIYLIPKFAQLFNMPLEAIIGMGTKVNKHIVSLPTLVMYSVVPFNLLKATIVSVVTFFIYKPISKVLKMEHRKIAIKK